MNIKILEILNHLALKPFISQRILAEECNCSLGFINKSLKAFIEQGYVDENFVVTKKANELFEKNRPKNAIILAAGFGMRMVPVNTKYPKALIEVNGKPLIERMIEQLHEVGINEIYIVVGFMKESFEYLINEFGVKLIVNRDYAVKNNLYSLACAQRHIKNTYIIPCDIYFSENPFRKKELYSWYMVDETDSPSSQIRVNRKNELVLTNQSQNGNAMIGLSYLCGPDVNEVVSRLKEYNEDPAHNNDFWEETLYKNNKMLISARVVKKGFATEINTYEQLRTLDRTSRHLRSAAIETAADALGVKSEHIKNITILKKGMTNRSFLFECKNQRYVMRIPGEGTDQLINREDEAAVFSAIKGLELCDDPVYINAKNGYKITRFINDARACDIDNEYELELCMKKLRRFHELNIVVPHDFDIFGNIDYYESLRGEESMYRDYEITKKNVLSLKTFIDKNIKTKTLCHIDSVPDNFLFDPHTEGELSLQLTDWEYAGMQDPHVDIAMFCIYSLYNKEQIDKLIDIYFNNDCDKNTRLKIYCYIAACGLLWSNWCEYKHHLGVEFGEYSLMQYHYAKEYYRIFKKETEGSENE